MIKSMKNFILILAVAFIWGSFSNDLEGTTPSIMSKNKNLEVGEEQLKKPKPDPSVDDAMTYGAGNIIVGSVEIGLGVAGVFSPEFSNALILVGSGFVLGGVASGCYGIIRKLSKANSGVIK